MKKQILLLLAVALIAPAVAVSQTLAPVNLGTTANFAILAGSLVSNVPTSAVTGNIGLSPAAGSNITGFGLTEVTGTIYAVDATGPAGSVPAAAMLTAAKGDLTIAYNDAAGRTPVPTGTFLNPGSGNIGGMNLVPGLYKFTSGCSITGSNDTLTGSATDVWIFQIASTLTVGNGIHVVLAGGAKASNVFWQVGTSATLGTTSVMQGTIMADQSISLGAGATLNGRALASSAAVTISSSTVTNPTAGQVAAKVTFMVNTATAPDTVVPVSAVQIRGSKAPLTWDNATGAVLSNVAGDYWAGTFTFNVGDTVNFKINVNGAWEANPTAIDTALGGGNRTLIVKGDTTLPLQYFNSVGNGTAQYFVPWTPAGDTMINVYFRVDMQGRADAGQFNMATDSVAVRGGGPAGSDLDWGTNFQLKRESPAANGGFVYDATYFWSGRLRFPKSAITSYPDTIQYKFLIGPTWGQDESSNRTMILNSANDTTLYWAWYNNQKPIVRANPDTVIITYTANMTTAIQNGAYFQGDTLQVTSGYFVTAKAQTTKNMLRLSGNIYQATDTVITAVGKTLDYSYYTVKNGVSQKDTYYNFAYTGAVASEAERRQVNVTSKTMAVNDTSLSIVTPRRQPTFPSKVPISQQVVVTYAVDVRPAFVNLKNGKTLKDIQGTADVTSADSIRPWGVAINGPATGGWATWSHAVLFAVTDTAHTMFDDGTHGDAVAGDSIYSRSFTYPVGTVKGQEFKFSIGGGDVEGGNGGYGNNHIENIVDQAATYTIASQFGSINPLYYNWWNYDTHTSQIGTGVQLVNGVPTVYALDQNYPNPFNPSTTIRYSLPATAYVTLRIYNILGQEVASLVDGKQQAGQHVVVFEGLKLSSGVYFYHINAGPYSAVKKMVLLK